MILGPQVREESLLVQADVNQDHDEDEEEQVYEEMATGGLHTLTRLLLPFML